MTEVVATADDGSVLVRIRGAGQPCEQCGCAGAVWRFVVSREKSAMLEGTFCSIYCRDRAANARIAKAPTNPVPAAREATDDDP